MQYRVEAAGKILSHLRNSAGRAAGGSARDAAGGNGGSTLPFQRKGESRAPIKAVKTVSVPQMIGNRAYGTVNKLIGENVEKRFQHHIAQAMK